MREPLLGLPFRVGPDGWLIRGERHDVLVGLFRAMAATSSAAWPHAPWFGLQEIFASANMRLEDQQQVADALNRALAGLGVGWAHIVNASTAPTQSPGERAFRLTIVLDGASAALHTDLAV